MEGGEIPSLCSRKGKEDGQYSETWNIYSVQGRTLFLNDPLLWIGLGVVPT